MVVLVPPMSSIWVRSESIRSNVNGLKLKLRRVFHLFFILLPVVVASDCKKNRFGYNSPKLWAVISTQVDSLEPVGCRHMQLLSVFLYLCVCRRRSACKTIPNFLYSIRSSQFVLRICIMLRHLFLAARISDVLMTFGVPSTHFLLILKQKCFCMRLTVPVVQVAREYTIQTVTIHEQAGNFLEVSFREISLLKMIHVSPVAGFL